jgi:hypothetical protein
MDLDLKTYHCICSQLVLVSTDNLDDYARRSGESLDKAHIIPLISIPNISDQPEPSPSHSGPRPTSYAILLNASPESKSTIIRRSDGFDSRYQCRCVRCNLVVGYQLDKSQFDDGVSGPREDIIYILPGAVVTTAEMVEGKDDAS